MNSITTTVFFILCCALLTACDFDSQRQLDLQYPVTFEISNSVPNSVTVKSIYNSADTNAGFVLKGSTIPPGKSFKLKISETTLNAISSGKYFLEGKCDNNQEWLVAGKHLKNSITHNENEWKITITIEDCINHI